MQFYIRRLGRFRHELRAIHVPTARGMSFEDGGESTYIVYGRNRAERFAAELEQRAESSRWKELKPHAAS